MPFFRKRTEVIEAHQFFPDQPLPPGVESAEDDDRQTVGKSVLYWVTTAHGQRVYLKPGDWVRAEPNGKGFYPITPDIFVGSYDPIGAPSPRCPKFPKGEQCGLREGHEGGCQWLSGD